MKMINETDAVLSHVARQLLAKGGDVPVGRHDVSNRCILVEITEGHVERHPGTNGDGTDEYTPTIKISVLAALALAVKASGEDILTVVEHALKVSEQIDQNQREVVEMIEPIQDALKTVDKKLSSIKSTRKSKTTVKVNATATEMALDPVDGTLLDLTM